MDLSEEDVERIAEAVAKKLSNPISAPQYHFYAPPAYRPYTPGYQGWWTIT